MPFGVVADGDRNPLVVTFAHIGIVRRHHLIVISLLTPIASVHRIVSEPFVHLTDDGFAHARVDPLAFAGAIPMAQRRERVKYDSRGDSVVRPGATGLAWRTTGVALRVEHP